MAFEHSKMRTLKISGKKYDLINGIPRSNTSYDTIGNRDELLNNRYKLYDLLHGIKTKDMNQPQSTGINQNFKEK